MTEHTWTGPKDDRQLRVGRITQHALTGSAGQLITRLQRIIGEHPNLDPRDIRGSGAVLVGTTYYSLGRSAEEIVAHLRRIVVDHPDLPPDAPCGQVRVMVAPGITEHEAASLQDRAEATARAAGEG